MNDVQKITEWSQRIHELALSKGWWQDGIEKRSVAEIVSNYYSEILEAWEEYRAGRMNLWWSYNGNAIESVGSDRFRYIGPCLTCATRWSQNRGYSEFVTLKPEGFWLEASDLVIRIMDAMGAYGWAFKETTAREYESIPLFIKRLRKLADMDTAIVDAWHPEALARSCEILLTCTATASAHGVDLWSLIELKHAYNQTRPIRHGGKLA